MKPRWRDCSEIRNTDCSCKGSRFDSHPTQVTASVILLSEDLTPFSGFCYHFIHMVYIYTDNINTLQIQKHQPQQLKAPNTQTQKIKVINISNLFETAVLLLLSQLGSESWILCRSIQWFIASLENIWKF